MKQSLFVKYFRICAAIILLSITFLGVVLLLFASQYFKDDKYSLLTNNVSQAVGVTLANYRNNDYRYVNSDTLTQVYDVLGGTMGAQIFLVDTTGKTLLVSHGESDEQMNYLIPQHIIDKVMQGEYRERGNLGGIYKEQYFTVGQPLINPNSGVVVGMVFASTSASSINTFLLDMAKMFAISALGAILASFVLIYFVASSLVRPLRQMLAATHSFSKGDFTVRVPVESEDEMGQLAIAFNSMASSLAQLESMRRSFTANVSHELKTPMTTISGFIDGILDGTIPPEKRDYYLEIVSTETKRLSRLVRSMLSIARIEAGEMELVLAPVDIGDIICRTIFTFEPAIEGKRIEVRGLDSERMVAEADPDLLHQVVYNLVENAVKFTPEDGYIEFFYHTDGQKVYTTVRNSGPGLPQDEIPHLFDRFYKSDKSRGLDKSGVGLGLYIVKTILTILEGEIFVANSPGEYIQFTFSLPVSSPQKQAGLFRKNSSDKQKQQ